MPEAPSGTITFLFTDIEGSTRRWDNEPVQMGAEVAQHDSILRDAVERYDGFVFATGGDGFAVAFSRAGSALCCAIDVQTALQEAGLPPVRMGAHTGEAEERGGDYFGPAVNRAARVMAIGHGGQVLLSAATQRLATEVEARDLGEHRLRDLSEPERVFQLVAPGLPADFPPLRSLDVLATNLPVQLTSLVGRGGDVKAVEALMGEHRAVTLTGVGGVGKTRLAQQVAADLLDRYQDGAWLVELASIEAPRVVEVIAGVLSVDLPPGRVVEDTLIDVLRTRETLVVLDNCEHIVREVRRIAERILREAPSVAILATSREGLRIPGEQLFSVPSLDDDAAMRLFVERAHAVDSTFVPGDQDTEAIASLCERLDGIPLAIELAAARVTMFSLGDLERRVEQRFRLLTGGRGAVERHQTLRAAIDWSYDLLEPTERVVLARLAVFASGCTLEAAEQVVADVQVNADDVLDVLSSLVDKSLVNADRTRAETRFEMLETIRQYAQERLVDAGESEATRARHARWCAGFARACGRGLYSPDELEWVQRLEDEIDNLQVAVGWAVGAGETDTAMWIGASFTRQPVERPLLGTAHLSEQALRVAGAAQHPAYARVLAEAAWAAMIRGEREAAERLLEESIAAQRGGARFAATAYVYLTTLYTWSADRGPRAYELALEGLTRAEAAGDVLGEIGLRITFASMAMSYGYDDDAVEHAQRALNDARRLRQPTLEASALYANGLAFCQSDPQRAMAMLRESIELSRRLGDEQEYTAALPLLALLEARHGDRRISLELLREEILARRRVSKSLSTARPYYVGPNALNAFDRPDLVAQSFGHARSRERGNTLLYDRFLDMAGEEARAALGEEEFSRNFEIGAVMTAEEVDDLVLREVDVLLAGD